MVWVPYWMTLWYTTVSAISLGTDCVNETWKDTSEYLALIMASIGSGIVAVLAAYLYMQGEWRHIYENETDTIQFSTKMKMSLST